MKQSSYTCMSECHEYELPQIVIQEIENCQFII